jgi:hypothetical protein
MDVRQLQFQDLAFTFLRTQNFSHANSARQNVPDFRARARLVGTDRGQMHRTFRLLIQNLIFRP